jgi:Protein of unknown function (DUF3592)
MDNALLGVVLVVVGAVSVAIVGWLVSQYKHRRLTLEAAQWIPVEATIESGALEGTRESARVVLPTFAFSYKVSDQYYSGRFSLRTNLSRTLAESMIGKMVGRKVLVRYDPKRPEESFIPDKLMDGYSVEQNLGSRSHVIHDYSPRD